MKQVCVAGKVRYWAVPEKIHTPPTEEISAVRRGRGEKMVSDNHRRRKIVKDDIQSNLRMCGKYCLWGAQTNHINVNYMKYLGH